MLSAVMLSVTFCNCYARECYYAEWVPRHSAQWQSAERHSCITTLSINNIHHTNISVILLSVEIYSFIYCMSLCCVSWCLLSYAKLNAVMLSVIMLSVVAPFTGTFTWQFRPDKYLRNSLTERSKQNDVYITYIYWGHNRSFLDIVRMCSFHPYLNSDGLRFT